MALLDLLVCPLHRAALEPVGDELLCAKGHRFPISDSVPVLLVEDLEATHPVCAKSIANARAGPFAAPDLSPEEIEPAVQEGIAATCGHLYRHLVGRLPRYPIPELRLPPGNGGRFLELGSNWGRWCIAAAERGYQPVGIDPSLEAIRAARRIARQLGVRGQYVVADARRLPFHKDAFDVVFSYSVFQHFAKENVRLALQEVRRVLRPGGTALVQMANALGVRSVLQRARERVRPGMKQQFRVRYWRPGEILRTFEAELGPSTTEVDGFFSLNPQMTDLDLMPARYRALIRGSAVARALAGTVPPLKYVADSLYVRSTLQ